MNKDIKDKIQSIPIWKNDISIKNLDGGMTNQNFLVSDQNKKVVVRLGKDILEHHIFIRNPKIIIHSFFWYQPHLITNSNHSSVFTITNV